jgi:ABC-type multidrug transport system ATPase subunit
MIDYKLKLDSITKFFGRRLIFKNISIDYQNNGIFGISGPNGSGKSNLVKIIANIISPSSGKVIHSNDSKEIPAEKLHNYIGFVSPYLVLYDEFTAEENIKFFANIRSVKYNKEKIDYLFSEFLLEERRYDLVKTYSSGMKQRLKFIFALMHSPKLIILDEPTSNLDNEGKEKVYKLINEESKNNIVFIASNEDNDLSICSETINLFQFKNNNTAIVKER